MDKKMLQTVIIAVLLIILIPRVIIRVNSSIEAFDKILQLKSDNISSLEFRNTNYHDNEIFFIYDKEQITNFLNLIKNKEGSYGKEKRGYDSMFEVLINLDDKSSMILDLYNDSDSSEVFIYPRARKNAYSYICRDTHKVMVFIHNKYLEAKSNK